MRRNIFLITLFSAVLLLGIILRGVSLFSIWKMEPGDVSQKTSKVHKSLEEPIPYLLEPYIYFRHEIMGVDAIPNSLRRGKQGWLFLGNEYSNVFSESSGWIDYPPQEVDAICLRVAQIRDLAESRGIKFYFAVAQNKHRFYRKFMPTQPIKQSFRMELVEQQLARQYGIQMIDLCRDMYPLKDSVKLYYQGDTHWNPLGAFYASKKLTDCIRVDFPSDSLSLKLNDFAMDSVIYTKGDLESMINPSPMEPSIQLTPIGSCSNKSDLKIVIVGDSFYEKMQPFINYAAPHAISLKNRDLNGAMMDKEKPDVLVFEIVERNLSKIPLWINCN